MNQEPSDAFEASFSKSGGANNLFDEYGAATLFLDDEKHPALKCIADDVDDIDGEVNDPLLMLLERDAFNFKDLIFPLVDCPRSSSTINSDFSSKILLIVISGMMLLSFCSTGAGKFNGIHTLANKPASIPPF